MDPRWNNRTDVQAWRSGDWTTKSILLGGGGGRYGLGGIVGYGADGATTTLKAVAQDGSVQTLRHLELWYQSGPGYGGFWASANGHEVTRQTAVTSATTDQRYSQDLSEGFTKLAFGMYGGTVPWYGVVLETGTPGATWEALGVIGVGSRSFTTYNQGHLHAQLQQRNPDLVAVMLGGNEAGLPSLAAGDGTSYVSYYRVALDTLKAGAPNASCLVISPLDQATRDGEKARTKAAIPTMVAAQKIAAQQDGCAFWDAFDAMGGSGTIVRWSQMRSPLAWTDLIHLSGAGQKIIGDLLADALLKDYDHWLSEGAP
jgi:lysophospholipase L1-like esterase